MYPGYSTKSAGGKLQLNPHAPYVYKIWLCMNYMTWYMVDPEHADVETSHVNNQTVLKYSTWVDIQHAL